MAKTFGNRWNCHYACGTIDGKHVAIKKQHQSGSEFYNYKAFCSIVLLGMVDEDYKFLWISVGGNGTGSDAGIISEYSLRAALEENTIRFHPAEHLPQDYRNISYLIPAHGASPIRPWLMKPYSMKGMTHEQRVFNFRQSQARRVVENIFGILVQRWRWLSQRCKLQPCQCQQGL